MPSLRELWRSVFPQARPFPAPGPALDRPVAWVRVLKARVPAFDALEPEDLAIVGHQTLDNLRALGVEPASVIEAVATAGGSGVLLIGEPGNGGGAPATTEMLQRSATRGLAAFELGEGDAVGLERSAIAFIVAGEAELERRVAQLEGQLEQAALAGAGIGGLAAIIGRFLARPVAVEGPSGELLAIHAPPDAPDAPNIASFLQHRRGEALRVALPSARADARRLRSSAAVLLLGASPPSELEQLAARRVSGLLALELGRGHAPQATGPAASRERLPAAGPDWVVIVARQLDERQPTTFEQRERLRHELLRSEPAGRLMLRGDAASLELRLIAAPEPSDPGGQALARRVARLLGRPVALSRPFGEPSERAAVEAQARITLEALEALPAAERAGLADEDGLIVARSELAPAYRLLASVPALPDGVRHAQSLLAPLLSGRPQRDRRLLATLRAVLEHDGLAEAAAALGIHRNTLAYRLARIEQQTGWSLADSRLRFSVALAVRLVQNAQEANPEWNPGATEQHLATP